MIKIFDNFYTKDENDKVNLKLSEPHWSYTGGGQTEENDYFSFFWLLFLLFQIDKDNLYQKRTNLTFHNTSFLD